MGSSLKSSKLLIEKQMKVQRTKAVAKHRWPEMIKLAGLLLNQEKPHDDRFLYNNANMKSKYVFSDTPNVSFSQFVYYLHVCFIQETSMN